MNNTVMVCPKDGAVFLNDDYCPDHGVPLSPLSATEKPQDISVEPVCEDRPGIADSEAETQRKISGFFDRLHRTMDISSDGSCTDYSMGDYRESRSFLPDELQKIGWQEAGSVQYRPGVDCWSVECTMDGGKVVSGFFNRHRSGALTTERLYTRIQERAIPVPGLAQIWAHGTVDVAGARADYELVAMPRTGDCLAQWLADGVPSELRAWHLFKALVQLLCNLEQNAIQPILLEPSQLSFMYDDELWLTTAEALTDVIESEEYRPEFTRSPLLSSEWAAPELTQQAMLSENSVLFSVGQLLARATWGQPCSVAELQSGAVPFHTLADSRLARVMMGCLWPYAKGRWSCKDLFKAASCESSDLMPTTSSWCSLLLGTAASAFHLAENAFWRLEDLLDAAVRPENWNEVCRNIDSVLEWTRETAWKNHVQPMREALDQGRSADWVLVALNQSVHPDAPPTWRGLDLSDAEAETSLAGLAQSALNGSESGMATLKQFFKADLRNAFNSALPND